ncbi:MAG: hypothetical protein ACYDAN_13280 [Candidatus Limnocylindrales bacterium]
MGLELYVAATAAAVIAASVSIIGPYVIERFRSARGGTIDQLLAELERDRRRGVPLTEERLAKVAEVLSPDRYVSLPAETRDWLRELLQPGATPEPHLPDLRGAAIPPYIILVRAHSSRDYAEKQGLIQAVLEHPDADSDDLESAGDIARQELRDDAVARQLYERAVAVDPRNVSAEAELLHLMASSPTERDAAVTRVLSLALSHPEHRVVVARALDALIEVSDYERMLKFVDEMLEKSSLHGILLRNRAVAMMELGGSPDDIAATLEDALRAATGEGRADVIANVARTFARFLRDRGPDSLPHALSVAEDAIKRFPSSAELHVLRGQVLKDMGEYRDASIGFEIAERLGPPDISAIATRERRDVAILRSLQEHSSQPALDVFQEAADRGIAAGADTPVEMDGQSDAEDDTTRVIPFKDVQRRAV